MEGCFVSREFASPFFFLRNLRIREVGGVRGKWRCEEHSVKELGERESACVEGIVQTNTFAGKEGRCVLSEAPRIWKLHFPKWRWAISYKSSFARVLAASSLNLMREPGLSHSLRDQTDLHHRKAAWRAQETDEETGEGPKSETDGMVCPHTHTQAPQSTTLHCGNLCP